MSRSLFDYVDNIRGLPDQMLPAIYGDHLPGYGIRLDQEHQSSGNLIRIRPPLRQRCLHLLLKIFGRLPGILQCRSGADTIDPDIRRKRLSQRLCGRPERRL